MVPNHARYHLRYTPKQLYHYKCLQRACQGNLIKIFAGVCISPSGGKYTFVMKEIPRKNLKLLLAAGLFLALTALKLLERQGCIEREAEEHDLRKKRIRITEKGREVAQRYIEAFSEVDEAMYGGFTEAELGTASDFFERMTENLRALAGQEAEG